MGILKIVVRILSYICYAVIGVYALICAPMVTGAKPVVVLSGSMKPTFDVGTIIYYKAVPQDELQKDDIITFRLGDELVTHRVKRIENGNYITQGDANNIEDSKPIPYADVQGRVSGLAIPILGYGVQFINSNMWLFIVIVVILLAEFLLSNMKSGKINTSKKEKEKEN